jgi:hypothetical protein
MVGLGGKPEKVYWRGALTEVARVIARWREEERPSLLPRQRVYYLVQLHASNTLELYQDTFTRQWRVTQVVD